MLRLEYRATFWARAIRGLCLVALLAVWFWLMAFIVLPTVISTPYDHAYFSRFFYQSQWSVPQSHRIMSDNELYRFAGYELATNLFSHPPYFRINPEVPPLGKLLYGWTTLLTGRPLLLSLLLYGTALLLFWFFARRTANTQWSVWFMTAVFALTPLLWSQVLQTMLDLPQLVCVLGVFACVISFSSVVPQESVKRYALLGLCGFFLGCFGAVKVPALLPVYVCIVVAHLLGMQCVSGKKQFIFLNFFKQCCVLFCGVLIGFGFWYLPYLMSNSPISLARSLKWMVSFYAQSGAKPIWYMPSISLLTGWYKNWSQPWMRIAEWQVLWVFGVVLTVLELIKHFWSSGVVVRQNFKKNFHFLESNSKLVTLCAVGCFFITPFIFLHLTPFWPRYFLLLLPFLFLFLARYCGKWVLIDAAVTIVALSTFFSFSFSQPLQQTAFMREKLITGSYEELYNYLDTETRSQVSREQFFFRMKTLEAALRPVSLDVQFKQPSAPSLISSTAQVPADFSITTPFGNLTFKVELPLQRELGGWVIAGERSPFLRAMIDGRVMVDTHETTMGTVRDKSGKILSEPRNAKILFVHTALMDATKKEAYIVLLHELTGIQKVEIEQKLFVNTLREIPVEFEVLEGASDTQVDVLTALPGLELRTARTRNRTYAVSLTPPQRSHLEAFEDSHPELVGSSGVVLYYLDESGTRHELEKTQWHEGKDLVLE